MLRTSFFWGAPSHKPIAWAGAVSGLIVVALAVLLLVIGHGAPVFLVALLCVGLANFGWAGRASASAADHDGRVGASGALGMRPGRSRAGDTEPDLGFVLRPGDWADHRRWRHLTE